MPADHGGWRFASRGSAGVVTGSKSSRLDPGLIHVKLQSWFNGHE
jgi:hypothetical protein